MINLFKAYQVASDGDFVRYIKTKRDRSDNGYNLSPDKLITSALNKFEILRKDNKWNFMSPEQEKIIDLASAVEKLKDDNQNLSNNFKSSPPRKSKGNERSRVRIYLENSPNMEEGKRIGKARTKRWRGQHQESKQ